ncbi:hypothetical protein CGJ93_22910, partial [Vibrio parahaemolyticus]
LKAHIKKKPRVTIYIYILDNTSHLLLSNFKVFIRYFLNVFKVFFKYKYERRSTAKSSFSKVIIAFSLRNHGD